MRNNDPNLIHVMESQMTAIVQLWSGREARALREAKRMSIKAFAAHLGVSERMVAKWEAAGETIHPRPVNQAALDTSLACSGADVQERFKRFTNTFSRSNSENLISDFTPLSVDDSHQIRHPVDGKLMALITEGIFLSGADDEPIWLPAFYVDLFPTPISTMPVSLRLPPAKHQATGRNQKVHRTTSLITRLYS